MELSRAVELVKGISYKPGWMIRAKANARYASTIYLWVRYEVPNSNPECAPGYTIPIEPIPEMEFWLHVADCDTDLDLYGKVIECLLQVERHETREFFGVNGTAYDKPFHPHTIEGMANWANRKPVVQAEDMALGVLVHA